MQILRFIVFGMLAALGIFSSIASHAQLLLPPILTCNGQSTTPEVVYPSQLKETLNTCRIPDDCIDSKRYPLFMARDVMRVLIEQLQAEGATPS